MPTGSIRLAFETVSATVPLPGNEVNTPTLSTKKVFVPATSVEGKYNAKPLSRDDEIRNQDEPIAVIPDAYDPDFGLKTRAYPDFLGFVLKWILGTPTTTTGDGIITDPDAVAIPTGAYKHVWAAPFTTPAGASPFTCQADIGYADQSTYFKQKGIALAELGIDSPETGGVMLDLNGPGLYHVRQSNPSLSPSYEALTVYPFRRGGLSLPTFLSGTGTHEDFGLKITQGVEPVRSLGIASKFPDTMEKANEGPIVVAATLKQRQLDPDDIDYMVANTGFSAVARWVNDAIIASLYPHKLYVAMSNAQLVTGEADPLENRRRHGADFEVKSTTASSGSTTVTLINSTPTYV